MPEIWMKKLLNDAWRQMLKNMIFLYIFDKKFCNKRTLYFRKLVSTIFWVILKHRLPGFQPISNLSISRNIPKVSVVFGRLSPISQNFKNGKSNFDVGETKVKNWSTCDDQPKARIFSIFSHIRDKIRTRNFRQISKIFARFLTTLWLTYNFKIL